MPTFDIILIIILIAFALYGFWLGFINAVGGIVGIFAGIFIAGRAYLPFSEWLGNFIPGAGFSKILAFILLFLLMNKATGLLFYVFDKAFHVIAIIPFLKSFNRLLGAAVGTLEGTLAIAGALTFAVRFEISSAFTQTLSNSELAPFFLGIAKILIPLLPELVKQLKSII